MENQEELKLLLTLITMINTAFEPKTPGLNRLNNKAWLYSNKQSNHLVQFSNSILSQLVVTMETLYLVNMFIC